MCLTTEHLQSTQRQENVSQKVFLHFPTELGICFKQIRHCIRLLLPAHLEVYDHCKHKDSGDEVHEVRQVLSVEGFSQGAHLVRAGGQQMEESNDGSLKLRTWMGQESQG